MVARRVDGLHVEAVQDEYVVFSADRSAATAINQAASIVFDRCDGEHSIDDMVRALEEAGLGAAGSDAVWLALRDLSESSLIILDAEPPPQTDRRSLLKRLAVTTIVTLPVVETVFASPAAAMGSATPMPTTPAPTNAPTPGPTPAPTTPAPTPMPTTPAPTSFPTPGPTPAPV